MRSLLLGLSVPLLLLAAAFTTTLPHALAQDADEPQTFTVSGRVVSDAGVALSGVQVYGYTYADDMRRSYPGSNANAVTDEDGRFELTLSEGRGYINIHYEKWRQGDGREVVVDEDITDLEFTLRTPPPRTAIIEGVVVGPDGEPIEDAEVSLQYACCESYPHEVIIVEDAAGEAESNTTTSSSEPMSRPAVMPMYYDDYQTARTDEDGKFRFEAYAGPRQIVAWAKGYAQTTVRVDAEDNETTEVEVELVKVPARDAIIEGRIVDSETGLPLRNAQINVRSLEWGRHAWAQTDSDGRYRVETVPGWTEIGVSYYHYPEAIALDSETSDKISMPRPMGQQYYPYTTVIDLDSGDNDLEIDLVAKPKPTIALLGYVVDPDAKKGVAGARVNVWNHETGDWGEAVTDATGSFRILVREGHYTINAWKEGHLSGAQSFAVSDDLTQRQDVILPKGEMRHAPCYDESDCGGAYHPYPIAYAEQGKAEPAPAMPVASPTPAMAGSSAPPPPAEGQRDAPMVGGGTTAESDMAATAPGSESRTGAATFSGSGGGLPEYDPESAGAIPAAQQGEPPAAVPGAGALLVALALVGAAFIVSRRK